MPISNNVTQGLYQIGTTSCDCASGGTRDHNVLDMPSDSNTNIAKQGGQSLPLLLQEGLLDSSPQTHLYMDIPDVHESTYEPLEQNIHIHPLSKLTCKSNKRETSSNSWPFPKLSLHENTSTNLC